VGHVTYQKSMWRPYVQFVGKLEWKSPLGKYSNGWLGDVARDTIVGITTRYGLDCPGIESR
jgi:hypothetical protein